MKEVLYTISGKRLPVVFNIGARALTSQALNIHAGHDDVMSVADTGWGMLFARNAQGAADLCLIARRAAEASQTPFFNVQDGFLTTHTLENVLLPEPEFMKQFLGSPGERLTSLMDPARALQSGVVQNQDAYMKGKIAQRYFTDRIEDAVRVAMAELAAKTGRHYGLIEPYRMDGAEYAIVALGSMAETAMATVEHLRAEKGLAAGAVHVTCFRPFPSIALVEALSGCKAVAVIERMDNPLAQSNPLAAEVKSVFADAASGRDGYPRVDRIPEIYSASAGLGGRDVRPGDFIATFAHIARGGGRRYFVLGIPHPLAVERAPEPDVRPPGAFSMRGHSVGGYGSITTNMAIATVLGESFGLKVQAYPLYGSEKKGLPTTYYLTAASEPIRTHCELDHVDFVPLNNLNAFSLGNPLAGIGKGGTLFLQTAKNDPQVIWRGVPLYAQRIIREKRLRVLHLDAARIAAELASRRDLQVRMQGIVLLGVFLRAMPYIQGLHLAEEELLARVEKALRRFFGSLGERIVRDNLECVRRGYREVESLPRQIILRNVKLEELALAGRRVDDLMTRTVVSCRPDTPLGEVVGTLRDRDVSAVVVVDGTGHLCGVLSSTDLRRAHLTREHLEAHLPEIFPSHLMQRGVLTTRPDESLEDAVRKLLDHHVHRLVVTAGDDVPIGILSMSDVVGLLRSERERSAAA
jgi:pyruvate-ferredoxin/flavodoxin oxidoreductase